VITRRPDFRRHLRLACVVLLFLKAVSASAQTSLVEKTFRASKAEVEKALGTLQASSGRLPILDGFVASIDSPLDRYQRGYYQYSLQITATGSTQATVRAAAKITAWYAGNTPAQSGYRVLPSNGRLEADLLDRIEEALNSQSTAAVPHQSLSKLDPPKPAVEVATKSLPDSPSLSSSSASTFPATRTTSPALPSREQALANKAGSNAADRRIQQLAQEAKNLEDILHNQARPENLAAVKESHTPVYDRPLDQAKVLFFAHAEDEFQIVDTTGAWVHVQISGISRGWIQRSRVSLPGSAPLPEEASAAANSDNLSDQNPFHPTREENSMFPGNWTALRGKTVKIIWVQPRPDSTESEPNKIEFAKSVFRKTYPQLSQTDSTLAGVVIVFDSKDGGMAAATIAALRQWNAGDLSDSAFWKQCWLDPVDAFPHKP
jgi:hypothetical protein